MKKLIIILLVLLMVPAICHANLHYLGYSEETGTYYLDTERCIGDKYDWGICITCYIKIVAPDNSYGFYYVQFLVNRDEGVWMKIFEISNYDSQDNLISKKAIPNPPGFKVGYKSPPYLMAYEIWNYIERR